MDDFLKSSRCKMNCLKSNFHRNTKMSDGFNPQCKICRNNFVNENLVKVKKIIRTIVIRKKSIT